MGESDDSSSSPTSPAWQSVGNAGATEDKPQSQAEGQQLEVARRFLEEDEVRKSSRGKKAHFLKSKGISDDDIEKLLGKAKEDEASSPSSSSSQVC